MSTATYQRTLSDPILLGPAVWSDGTEWGTAVPMEWLDMASSMLPQTPRERLGVHLSDAGDSARELGRTVAEVGELVLELACDLGCALSAANDVVQRSVLGPVIGTVVRRLA